MKLYTKILIGLAAGILAGWAIYELDWQPAVPYISIVGDLFMTLLKMLVIPLILASLIVGAANLGDLRKVGKLGIKAFGFFLLTTAVSVSIGITLANVMQPGRNFDEEKKTEFLSGAETDATVTVSEEEKSDGEKLLDFFRSIVPTNPVAAMAKGDMIPTLFFALFFGISLTLVPGDKSAPVISFFDGVNEVVLKMITLIMEIAPYGVFALMVDVVADKGIGVLQPLALYALVVVAGLILHVVITHGSFIVFYLRMNPIKFFKAIKEAVVFGFSTSSSSATLPISMNVAQKNLGISRGVASFVLPLGATINMDGTALYQGVAAIFIAQAFGLDLGFTAQLMIILTATLASVGAAGVPGAGIVMLAGVLITAGIPAEGIGLILGIDRILDMFRTTINIVGDITCSAVMAKSEGEQVAIYDDQDVIPG